MKKTGIILLIIVLVLLIILCVVIALLPNEIVIEPPKPSGEIIDTRTASEKIVVSDAITNTETQKRLIDIIMPTFGNLSDLTFQEAINTKIEEGINPYIKEISIVADESISKQYKYTVSYERYNNEDYISLVILQSYMTGGMRSNVWKDTYTIDVVKNKELKLADVCSSNNYKEIIVEEVNEQAKEKNINLIAGNGLADIPDTQRFYIKDKKLYILFEPASIAPYLDGELIFEMPYEFVNGKFILE